jgi:hypothetical protein
MPRAEIDKEAFRKVLEEKTKAKVPAPSRGKDQGIERE